MNFKVSALGSFSVFWIHFRLFLVNFRLFVLPPGKPRKLLLVPGPALLAVGGNHSDNGSSFEFDMFKSKILFLCFFRFLIELGKALNLSHNTMATGSVYYHRFYMFHTFQDFPKLVRVPISKKKNFEAPSWQILANQDS